MYGGFRDGTSAERSAEMRGRPASAEAERHAKHANEQRFALYLVPNMASEGTRRTRNTGAERTSDDQQFMQGQERAKAETARQSDSSYSQGASNYVGGG